MRLLIRADLRRVLRKPGFYVLIVLTLALFALRKPDGIAAEYLLLLCDKFRSRHRLVGNSREHFQLGSILGFLLAYLAERVALFVELFFPAFQLIDDLDQFPS